MTSFVARLHRPRGLRERIKQIASELSFRVSTDPRRQIRDEQPGCEPNQREQASKSEYDRDPGVEIEGSDDSGHARSTIDQGSRDLGDEREDSGLEQTSCDRTGYEG